MRSWQSLLAVLCAACTSTPFASTDTGGAGGQGGSSSPDASVGGAPSGGGSGNGGNPAGGSPNGGVPAETGGVTGQSGAGAGGTGTSGGSGGNAGASHAGASSTCDPAGAEGATVSLLNDDAPIGDSVDFELFVVNQSTEAIALGELEIRYYLTIEPTGSLHVELQYAAQTDDALPDNFRRLDGELDDGGVGTELAFLSLVEIAFVSGADHYASFTFSDSAGTLAPGGELEFYVSIHEENFSQDFNETNDYSHLDCAERSATERVVLRLGDATVYGSVPTGTD